jgi:hypothetical protein
MNPEIGLARRTKTMNARSLARPGAVLVVAAPLFLAACHNTYGPPPENGKPQNWGQQHYLDNQRYEEQNQNRMSD